MQAPRDFCFSREAEVRHLVAAHTASLLAVVESGGERMWFPANWDCGDHPVGPPATSRADHRAPETGSYRW